jgi:hypothetical protein
LFTASRVAGSVYPCISADVEKFGSLISESAWVACAKTKICMVYGGGDIAYVNDNIDV